MPARRTRNRWCYNMIRLGVFIAVMVLPSGAKTTCTMGVFGGTRMRRQLEYINDTRESRDVGVTTIRTNASDEKGGLVNITNRVTLFIDCACARSDDDDTDMAYSPDGVIMFRMIRETDNTARR